MMKDPRKATKKIPMINMLVGMRQGHGSMRWDDHGAKLDEGPRTYLLTHSMSYLR